MCPKRVAVVTSDVPFVEGGHLTIARSTVRALRENGHEADLILTPQNRFSRVFQAYLATRLTDVEEDGLGRKIDLVISFRFPSYAVRHPSHVCWLNHGIREYYDLWKSYSSSLGRQARLKEALRRFLIHRLDRHLLTRHVKKLFAQSKTIETRLIKWGNIPSEVLYPPPPQRHYRTDSYQKYIFAVSRLQRLKRLDLLVEAFRYVQDGEIKAYIAGDGPERERLANRIKEIELEKRVILTGPVDEETLLAMYAGCLAVFFCPYQEDYGFVTAEAFASGKAVITSDDSGGPAELVKDGETGFVIEPDPHQIAKKIDELAGSRGKAEEMGSKALGFVRKMTWEDAVRKLVI